MHKLIFALYATLLAGTHMADFNMPHSPSDRKAVIVPIQDYYGYYGGQYGFPGRAYPNYGSRYYPQGPDYYGAQGYGNYDYNGEDDITAGQLQDRRERRYQYRGGYNNPPRFGRGW